MNTIFRLILILFSIGITILISGCAFLQNLTGSPSDSVNYALASNGAFVTASNSSPDRDITTVVNGVTSSEGWDDGEGWECRFTRRRPDNVGWSRLDPKSNMEYGSAWLEVQLNSPKTINKVTVYTLDSAKYPASRYGIRDAWLQVSKEYGWTTVGEIQDGYIVSRTSLDRQPAGGKIVFKFNPVKTDKIRLVVFKSNDVDVSGEGWISDRKAENSVARVIEIEVTGLEKAKREDSSKSKAWVKPAPEFILQDINGNWFRLSNYKGSVVIITFWAAWSSEAQQQIRELNSLNSKYRNEGVVIFGISTDEGGAERIRSFVQGNNLNYPILIADTSVKTAYGGIGKLPTTFIIDQEGNIYKEYYVFRASHLLELDIKSLLASFQE